LQEYLGEEKMDEVMQDYYETWKFRHPGTEEFKATFTQIVDKDLSWFFDDAIDGTKVIDYAVSSINDHHVLIKNHGTMSSPLELAFYDKNNEEIDRVWLEGFGIEKKAELPSGTERVIIDPENYMPDINRTNNATSKKIKTHFIFDQPEFYENDIYYLPWVKWSEFNGISPGLSLYSGFVPGYPYGISLVPVWDFEHERLSGSLYAQRTLYQIMGFRSLTFSSSISQYEGRSGGMIHISGLRRKPVVSTPASSVSAKLFYHDIDSIAVSPFYYTSGALTSLNLYGDYSYIVNPFIFYSGGITFRSGYHQSAFSSVSLAGKVSWRYSKKLTVKVRGYVGSILFGEKIPNQYKLWMSGGVDPDFESGAIFNRTDNGGNNRGSRYDIYDEQYLQSGPALRGTLYASSEATAWGLNIDHSVPYIPLGIFLDVAGATDLEGMYTDLGIKMDMGFITLFFPLYQSWDEDSEFITNFTWLKTRARFEFSIPTTSFGR